MTSAPLRKKRASRTRQAFALDSQAARQRPVEVQMTDVLAPVLIPYARFLEVRAKRLAIVTELTQPDGQRPTDVTISSEPVAHDERARVAVSVVAADSAAGVEHS